jgi:hypothetical protein
VARKVFACLVVAVVCSPVLLVGACGSNALIGQGQPCYQSIDCELGLACVPNQQGNPDAGSTCTSNLNGISDVPEAGGDSTLMDTTPPMDSPVMDQVVIPDNNVPETPMDTGVQDTGVDALPPTDAGAG